MQKRGDADTFRFEAKAGQELVVFILSESIGSRLNGLLSLLAPDGSELANSGQSEFGNRTEGRVAFHFEKAGTYYLRITDKNFGEGGFYRLYAGALPFVTSFFPPGLQKGTTREISVKGFNLGGGMRVKVDAPAEASAPAPAAFTATLRISRCARSSTVTLGYARSKCARSTFWQREGFRLLSLPRQGGAKLDR